MASNEVQALPVAEPPPNAARFYSWFTFHAIEAKDMKSGDLVANTGTCTRVIIGPKTAKQIPDEWLRPIAGEVVYKCGSGFSCKGQANRIVIVGRRKWDEAVS